MLATWINKDLTDKVGEMRQNEISGESIEFQGHMGRNDYML